MSGLGGFLLTVRGVNGWRWTDTASIELRCVRDNDIRGLEEYGFLVSGPFVDDGGYLYVLSPPASLANYLAGENR